MTAFCREAQYAATAALKAADKNRADSASYWKCLGYAARSIDLARRDLDCVDDRRALRD